MPYNQNDTITDKHTKSLDTRMINLRPEWMVMFSFNHGSCTTYKVSAVVPYIGCGSAQVRYTDESCYDKASTANRQCTY